MATAHDLSLDLPPNAGRDAVGSRNQHFEAVARDFAAPLARLARANESDASLQQDLLQEIHLALWRSLAVFDNRCSLRTWVYRVAHNVAATHVLRSRRRQLHRLTTLDDVDVADDTDIPASVDAALPLARLTALIQSLKPLDRQVMILHLEGISAEEIGEIIGISPANTNTKLHRIRHLLAKKINSGDES
jgi:RNA polymerase sigma-70 factor (ECF subfamily)